MIAKLLSDEFFCNRDWPMASAVAIAMLLLLVVPIMIFQHFQNKELQAAKDESAMKTHGLFSKTMLGFGFAFLYVPILSMIFFSFNNSRLVTVWDAALRPR